MQVLLDLTTLDKCGKFKALDGLVVLYHGVFGQWRVPLRPDASTEASPRTPERATLGLRLLQGIEKALTQHFEVLLQRQTQAFGRGEFLDMVTGAEGSRYCQGALRP